MSFFNRIKSPVINYAQAQNVVPHRGTVTTRSLPIANQHSMTGAKVQMIKKGQFMHHTPTPVRGYQEH